MNILAVDDDELQLALLSATLADQGFTRPVTATSAQKALDVIKTSLAPFGMFLLDVRMPGMDGIQLCQRIRTIGAYKEVPVIMITALTDRAQMDRAFAAGASDYVTKPFDKLELITRIRLAHQAARSRKDVERQRQELSNLHREIYDSVGATPEAPVTIHGVPNVVDYLVLSNLMLELSFTRTMTANAFAVKIRNFDRLFLESALPEVYELLTSIAKSLSERLTGHGYYVAYAGSGFFVCAAQSRGISSEEILSDAQSSIRSFEFCPSSEQIKTISLDFGRLQSNGLFSADRRTGLLIRAIESAENLSKQQELDVENTLAGKPAHSTANWLQRLIGT